MRHRKLVHPQHMNHQDALFGGYLLQWIDEVAYITAKVQYPANRFVTVALDNVAFKHKIAVGEIICFHVTENRRGKTSLEYGIKVYLEPEHENSTVMFETKITFVSVDEEGNKRPISVTQTSTRQDDD